MSGSPPPLLEETHVNAVSPGWVAETLESTGRDGAEGTPVRDVARAYVEAVEGSGQGQVLRPSRTGVRVV